ncbi:MAG: hypothetical protein IJI98_11165 [Methanosphaera sp.]|nr:hypothetical protein [Methanobrevibacter sp.]MBR0351355.1 hypothetical protein [Clostridia bacterium]MBR0473239.1 hypothetical protein [Methanosphaera sp.]
MNNWDTMLTKRELFDLFENARILFNEYVNGISRDYTEEDTKSIQKLIELIEENIKEVKEMI